MVDVCALYSDVKRCRTIRFIHSLNYLMQELIHVKFMAFILTVVAGKYVSMCQRLACNRWCSINCLDWLTGWLILSYIFHLLTWCDLMQSTNLHLVYWNRKMCIKWTLSSIIMIAFQLQHNIKAIVEKRHCSFIDKLISDVRYSNLLLVYGFNSLYSL